MKTLLNLALITGSLTLTACSQISSTDVEASAIHGDIWLTQSEGSNSASVRTTFYVGGDTGTVVTLVSPAGVKVNGQTASEETDPIINMTSYVGYSNGNASVVYTDKDGGVYTNTISLPGSVSLSLASTTVYESQGLSMGYSSTNAFAAGEQLEITIEGSGGAAVFNKNANSGSTSGNVSVSAGELQGMTPGSYALRLCRKSYPAAQSPYPKGTNITSESCTNARTINLQM